MGLLRDASGMRQEASPCGSCRFLRCAAMCTAFALQPQPYSARSSASTSDSCVFQLVTRRMTEQWSSYEMHGASQKKQNKSFLGA